MKNIVELFIKPLEELDYYDYYQPLIRESRYIPGLMITHHDEGTLSCPNCNEKHKDIPHGEHITCECGLYMELWGRCLHIRK